MPCHRAQRFLHILYIGTAWNGEILAFAEQAQLRGWDKPNTERERKQQGMCWGIYVVGASRTV